jgi:hypothetical protein
MFKTKNRIVKVKDLQQGKIVFAIQIKRWYNLEWQYIRGASFNTPLEAVDYIKTYKVVMTDKQIRKELKNGKEKNI